ncbi:MAG: hypothetical protein AVDCRST_MAG68-875, partial [uncultured Gemmatimonadetes bacterium]
VTTLQGGTCRRSHAAGRGWECGRRGDHAVGRRRSQRGQHDDGEHLGPQHGRKPFHVHLVGERGRWGCAVHLLLDLLAGGPGNRSQLRSDCAGVRADGDFSVRGGRQPDPGFRGEDRSRLHQQIGLL